MSIAPETFKRSMPAIKRKKKKVKKKKILKKKT
jgi:hypothetical protein